MIPTKEFSLFDTVQVFYPDDWTNSKLLRDEMQKDIIKGFVIRSSLRPNGKYFDKVIIGFNKNKYPSYFGSNISLHTSRMVLIEKIDNKLHTALRIVEIEEQEI